MESQTGTEFAPSVGNLTMGGQEAGEDINGTVVTINSGGDQLIATHGRFNLGAGFGNKADGKGLSNSGAATQNLSWPNNLAAGAGAGTQTGSAADFIDSPAARIQNCAQIGQSNIVMGARHALKIVNGSQGHFRYTDANGNPIGLTIASEQPVYVQGNYNADNNDATNWGGYTHLSSAVVADAVTLLSNAFDDRYSLEYPSTGPSDRRNAATTYFRVAIAPQAISSTPGDGSVSLSWLPPASDGGAAITGYAIEYQAIGAVDWVPFGDSTCGDQLALVVAGLVNGTTYMLRVIAGNANGHR